MYLKSIEMHGFKSFANKIVLDFHNGMTGIVGPNGSGKSNVSDAVRWVLGEQSAKQLRGASMQDVIFSGTENRKPLSYAYVAITMDNSDHMLDIDFEEVTVARRVYRSGESEYLLNGSPCRLKDVNELFYDTGIGKEGYSIIGQGQIEKILNGRPEERRELFDEAAGIVKYKRRKATAQKKLESERENLIRINDILSELERQAGPLERQAEKAKIFLKKREELKKNDVNLFLMEMERIDAQLKEAAVNYETTRGQLEETTAFHEKMKSEYEHLEEAMQAVSAEIESERNKLNESTILKEKLEGQIGVLNEQIKAAELSDEHFGNRRKELESEQTEKENQLNAYEEEKHALDMQLEQAKQRLKKAEHELKNLQESIQNCNEKIDSGKNERMELLNQKALIQANQQKFDTTIEQISIQKAQLNQRLLQKKSSESGLEHLLEEETHTLHKVQAEIEQLRQKEQTLENGQSQRRQTLAELNRTLEETTAKYHKLSSRLESLRNIAERYDGYGNSIRKVMAQKEREPGLLGVVSDLIKVEKKYETAIETALGGSIQNIVTKDDETAKKMIAYLKQNRFGRATFLPLTSVKGSGDIKYPEALQEPGVIGLAHTLASYDETYRGIMRQLLGRVVVADTIDHAAALAKKYRYSLSIVTLEGESLRPGGSMTGGAFKNSGNLLGRNREMEELSAEAKQTKELIETQKARREELLTAIALNSDDVEKLREELQQKYLLENTAGLNVERARQQKEQSEAALKNLQSEGMELESRIREMKEEKAQAQKEIARVMHKEEELERETANYQEILDEQLYLEGSAGRSFSEAQMEEANIRQKSEFAASNIERVKEEIEKCGIQIQKLSEEAELAKEDVKQRKQQIDHIRQTIRSSEDEFARFEEILQNKVLQRDEIASRQKEFFGKREEITERISRLDKEMFRLNSQKEKLEESRERQNNYMWEEYELTPHNALAFREEACRSADELKKQILSLKDEIRSLGDVNVNAIEEYKEISARYDFLNAQHEDLIRAEEALVNIIEELDSGMRRQFTEKFAEIRREFDRAFQELFGGGKGTLELVEDEDILECGVRIIAQPPGKKLQNMILLSGGEKSLTAISLLFAIQNLKPSPFCLLDEIEAALDDSNVGRFADYLHKLTENTQFIVITHRRGTMASADRLYGITMQEKGVSTLVSVDLIEHDLEK